ncbi:MAG: NAD(P)/FAD-dependent oxidoreductase [Chloroflexi bacterium]|nr:NAD(P)/FAD-dependent oxidoreductase [Chloroflexota bacterium]
MAGKTIVILGGGVGGLVAGNRLRRLLDREHRVVLVDRSPWHTFAPAFTRVMLGRTEPRRITRQLRTLNRKGIEFIAAEVTQIDPANKKVRLEQQELSYDYLVVCLGAHYSAQEIPGLAQAWTYYHLEGAEGLRDELPNFKAGRIAIVVSSMPYKCPAAPYEGALLLDHYFRRRGVRADVEIRLLTPEPYPLPVAGQAVGQMVVDILAGREVWFSPGLRLKAVDQAAKKLQFEDGSDAPFDLLIATPVHRVPDVLRAAGLAKDGGWVSVDRETLATPFEDVYAIGDCAASPLANGMMLPKAGVFAHGQAEVVARNLAAEIAGGEPHWAFGGRGSCFLETGYGKAAYATGNFFAEPDPEVALRPPSFFWRWAKIGFERMWLWRWF